MRVEYTLVLRAESADAGVAAMALRGLLKVALRGFGLRCVEVKEGNVLEPAGGNGARGWESVAVGIVG